MPVTGGRPAPTQFWVRRPSSWGPVMLDEDLLGRELLVAERTAVVQRREPLELLDALGRGVPVALSRRRERARRTGADRRPYVVRRRVRELHGHLPAEHLQPR